MKKYLESIFLGKDIILLDPHPLAGTRAKCLRVIEVNPGRHNLIVQAYDSGAEIIIGETETHFLVKETVEFTAPKNSQFLN